MTTEQQDGIAIRTPDQRLRVFVSSTLTELAAERAAVARSIAALGLTPVMFELGARPHPPQDLYRAYLAQSDIFIGLYWQRYGWVGPGMDISGLEDELRLSGSLPRLMYVKTPAPDREARLAAMIAALQTEATASYRSFGSPRELGRLVRNDLALLLSERFSVAVHRPALWPTARDVGPAGHALAARDVDVVDRARARHRRGVGVCSSCPTYDWSPSLVPEASARRGWRLPLVRVSRNDLHATRCSCHSLRLPSPSW